MSLLYAYVFYFSWLRCRVPRLRLLVFVFPWGLSLGVVVPRVSPHPPQQAVSWLHCDWKAATVQKPQRQKEASGLGLGL